MKKTILILRMIWLYIQIYVVTPLGVLFRLPGFILYAIYVVLFDNDEDKRTKSGRMTRALDSIVEQREPNADQSRFIEEYSDKTLRLAYHFWIVVALIYTLNRYF